MGGESSSDACQIKVNVDFLKDSILDHYPSEKEKIEAICENMPSEPAANYERESKVKQIRDGVLIQTLTKIFQSVILGYEGTQILLNFTIIECDQDLTQVLINSGAQALMNSNFKIKCIPIAICILAGQSGEKVEVDPTLETITTMCNDFSHKILVVCDT